MVWEQRTATIVMMTRLEEKSRVRTKELQEQGAPVSVCRQLPSVGRQQGLPVLLFAWGVPSQLRVVVGLPVPSRQAARKRTCVTNCHCSSGSVHTSSEGGTFLRHLPVFQMLERSQGVCTAPKFISREVLLLAASVLQSIDWNVKFTELENGA